MPSEAAGTAFDLSVLRPTVVIGPGGRNLVKLARGLTGDHRLHQWLRRSVFGTRHMHLVPVEDVVAALVFLAAAPVALTGTYIVTNNDPANNFAAIERRLPSVIAQVRIGPEFDEPPHRRRMTVVRGKHQQAVTLLILHVHGDTGGDRALQARYVPAARVFEGILRQLDVTHDRFPFSRRFITSTRSRFPYSASARSK